MRLIILNALYWTRDITAITGNVVAYANKRTRYPEIVGRQLLLLWGEYIVYNVRYIAIEEGVGPLSGTQTYLEILLVNILRAFGIWVHFVRIHPAGLRFTEGNFVHMHLHGESRLRIGPIPTAEQC